MKKPALLEFRLGIDNAVEELRVVTKAELPTPSPQFQKWLDWAEPGDAFKARACFHGADLLYLCVDLTVEE